MYVQVKAFSLSATQISENTSTMVVISLRLTDEGATTPKLVSG